MNRSIKIALPVVFLILIALVVFIMIVRVRSPKHMGESDYSSFIESDKNSYATTIGERVEVPLKIMNQGKTTWIPVGENPYYLSYHLLDENGQIIRFDNRRFILPKKIYPGQKIDMIIIVRSPLEPGEYILEFDLLREGLFWFKDQGSQTSEITLSVKEKIWPEDEFTLGLDYGKYTRYSSSIKELNLIFNLMRLTLEKNAVEFSGKTGKIHGFSAGSEYPQIWLRDSNSVIGVAKYFYGEDYLISWLEEILAYQEQNGSLNDWIDAHGKTDKNTTETDQESGAVQAAFQIYKIFGPRWLEKPVTGERIIDRLERALMFVLNARLSPQYGLVTGAHTADWGDVDMVDADQQAIYVDERTHWTADIYDQSMFFQACSNLAEMMDALDKTKRGFFWREKARSIKENTDRWLWQEDKGFYRVHIHLDSLSHDFDEDDMFAMGGNTQAIISGLANEEQSRRIIQEALERQEKFHISTISGTLLPPYPKNLFKHPLLDDPYEYQNGAQWDWFGGRLVHAMFTNGFSSIAKEKLMEIISKNVTNRGFFEWDNRAGVGRGSDFYAGSAGSLGKALIEGYFGIHLKHNHLSIEPKLRKDSAKIHIYQPATDIYVSYQYVFDEKNNKLTLDFNSNFPQKGIIKTLIPWSRSSDKKSHLEKLFNVFIDGKKIRHRLERKNEDIYIVIESDFNSRRLEILCMEPCT